MRRAASVSSPRISVVLATYEEPALLDTTLRALCEQEARRGFEVVIADDGSGDSVAEVVERWEPQLRIRHVWQPDEGFRKARALNCAALSSTGDYLVFLDADCVPRQGFLDSIRRAAMPGWFLTTKRVDLSEALTARVLDECLPVWRWSAVDWLLRAPREVGRPGYLVPGRDRRRPWRPDQPDFVPPHVAYCLFGLPRESFDQSERIRRALHALRRRGGSGSRHPVAAEWTSLWLAGATRHRASPLASHSNGQDTRCRALVSRDGTERSGRSARRPPRAVGRALGSGDCEPGRRVEFVERAGIAVAALGE